MAIYLQVRVGSVGLLLDALRVHEVLIWEDTEHTEPAYAQWREQVLPVVRLARHLELASTGGNEQHAVVYSPGKDCPPVMLLVDEVARLRQLGPSHWQPMPRVPARTAQLFDAVWWDEVASGQVYRLRCELEPLLLGAQPLDSEELSAPAPT